MNRTILIALAALGLVSCEPGQKEAKATLSPEEAKATLYTLSPEGIKGYEIVDYIIYRSSAMLATTKDGQTIVTSVYTIIEK